jgi:hypothetical protein
MEVASHAGTDLSDHSRLAHMWVHWPRGTLGRQRVPAAAGRFIHSLQGLPMRWFLLSLLLFGAAGARAAEPLVNFNVVLLQPGSTLEERVPSVDAVAEYVRSIEAAARSAVVASKARQSLGGFIVVAVRPGLKSKVWLDFDALLDLEIRRQIIEMTQAVKPFEARKGAVVFALNVALWGGARTKRVAPSPPEWKKVTQSGAPLEVGELVEAAWNE